MKSKDGVRVEQIPEAVLSALRSAWNEVAKEEGGSDYFFRTVLEDIAKFGEAAQKKSAPAPVRGSGAVETKPGP
jgi:TRAP-type mannitol/chloroaromatic compound transport system substrate-binding protein